MNQLEDDLHRVLQLARAQSRLNRHKGGSAKKRTIETAGSLHRQSHRDALVAVTRHRHESLHTNFGRLAKKTDPPSTLLTAKLRSISALYGLGNATPKLSDCSAKTTQLQWETMHRQANKDSNAKAEHLEEEEQQQAILEAKLAARRDLYKRHYSGLHAAYGPTGLPKLECLLDAAQQAKAKMARHSALAIGASVLTSSNRIYASCTIESLHDAKFLICAERAALLKALGEDPGEVVTAMAIVSDQQQADLLPFPCGSCREFLAEFGDFPVYLVNGRCESEETRSFDLFPCARQLSTARVVQQQHQSQSHQSKGEPGRARERANNNSSKSLVNDDTDDDGGDHGEAPLIVKDWSTSHVLHWLRNAVELPQYVDIFKRSGVDGCTLLHLEDCDLQLLLGILQPLHRRRILVHIDRLKDRELLEHGIDYGQLQDYLAVLDRDRITVVAELKATFDRLDQNKDGFLDFREMRQALSTLQCDATPQAVETLLCGKLLSGDNGGGDSEGRVSFPDFAAAFSSLAMQPASPQDEEGRKKRALLQQQAQVESWQLPMLDINGLRGTFDKADRNKSGAIDEQELIALFRALNGKDNESKKSEKSEKECAQKAREWFEAADFDGDGRLSFAEFLIRYVQLTGLDITKLRAFFESSEPLESVRLKPVSVLKRALDTFFPDFSSAEISVWYKRHLNSSLLRVMKAEEPRADASEDQQLLPSSTTKPAKPTGTRSSLTISYADFVLSVFLFQVHTKERRQQVRELKGKMSNDALVHKSRIVHLQQTGHVRMCPQMMDTDASTTSQSLAEIRRKQQCDKQRNQKSANEDDEAKNDSDDSDEVDVAALAKKQKLRLERQLARVDATFNRFAQAKAKKNKSKPVSSRQRSRHHQHSSCDDDGRKQNDSDSEIDTQAATNNCELNAMETAQAMTELGVACARDQILRLLKDEGFGLVDCIDRRDFRRLFQHFHAQSESVYGKFPAHRRPMGTMRIWDEDAEHAKRMEHMAALLSGEYGKHRNRQDYDQYLVSGGDCRSGASTAPPTHSRKPWKKEMVRFHTEKQSQKRRSGIQKSERRRRRKKRKDREEREETKGESSDEDESSSNSSGDSDGSSSTASRRGGLHGRARRRVSRSRKGRGRHSSRSRRRKLSSGDSNSSSSFPSNETTESEREEELRRRRHQSLLQKKRGFEIGDRVFAHGDGNGTIIRLYRDYFVADVHFDSGTKAKNVDLAKLKRVDPFAEEHRMTSTRFTMKQSVALKVGMHVAVSHKGTRTTRKGKITRCRMDGTFDVLLTDKLAGEQDEMRKRVQAKHLRALGKPVVYAVGASVKVKQKHEYLRGKVGVCRTDGTYDVQLRRTMKGDRNNALKRIDANLLSPDEDDEADTDDEEDTPVSSHSNKKVDKASTDKRRSRAANDSDDTEEKDEDEDDEDKYEDFEPEFTKGDRIEARFQGKDAFYPGRIARVLSDGTFDVVYDDGDEEPRVKSHLIRAIAATKATTTGSKSNNATRTPTTTRQQDDYDDDGFESD